MAFEEITLHVFIIIGLMVLRLGVPLLVMWLFSQACCRILYVES